MEEIVLKKFLENSMVWNLSRRFVRGIAPRYYYSRVNTRVWKESLNLHGTSKYRLGDLSVSRRDTLLSRGGNKRRFRWPRYFRRFQFTGEGRVHNWIERGFYDLHNTRRVFHSGRYARLFSHRANNPVAR